jgi:hypothetical protein
LNDSDDFIAAADADFKAGLFKEAHIKFGMALSRGSSRENYCRQMRGMCSRRVAEQRLQNARDDDGTRQAFLLQAARWLAKAEANLESALEDADAPQRGLIRMEQALNEEAMAQFMLMSDRDPSRRLAEAERFRREAAIVLGPAALHASGAGAPFPGPA